MYKSIIIILQDTVFYNESKVNYESFFRICKLRRLLNVKKLFFMGSRFCKSQNASTQNSPPLRGKCGCINSGQKNSSHKGNVDRITWQKLARSNVLVQSCKHLYCEIDKNKHSLLDVLGTEERLSVCREFKSQWPGDRQRHTVFNQNVHKFVFGVEDVVRHLGQKRKSTFNPVVIYLEKSEKMLIEPYFLNAIKKCMPDNLWNAELEESWKDLIDIICHVPYY